jgi:hypothetical protein
LRLPAWLGSPPAYLKRVKPFKYRQRQPKSRRMTAIRCRAVGPIGFWSGCAGGVLQVAPTIAAPINSHRNPQPVGSPLTLSAAVSIPPTRLERVDALPRLTAPGASDIASICLVRDPAARSSRLHPSCMFVRHADMCRSDWLTTYIKLWNNLVAIGPWRAIRSAPMTIESPILVWLRSPLLCPSPWSDQMMQIHIVPATRRDGTWLIEVPGSDLSAAIEPDYWIG